jgi:hypothetical protein
MAKAQKNTRTEMVPQPPVPKEVVESITLTLTPDEASTLYQITGRVGGPPVSNDNKPTPRGLIERIRSALDSSGVTSADHPLTLADRNSIYFADNPKPLPPLFTPYNYARRYGW